MGGSRGADWTGYGWLAEEERNRRKTEKKREKREKRRVGNGQEGGLFWERRKKKSSRKNRGARLSGPGMISAYFRIFSFYYSTLIVAVLSLSLFVDWSRCRKPFISSCEAQSLLALFFIFILVFFLGSMEEASQMLCSSLLLIVSGPLSCFFTIPHALVHGRY